MTVETFEPSGQVMNLSEIAADKVKEFILEEGNPSLLLRVFVTGGGCSGFMYGFTFANPEELGDEDTVFTQHGVQIVIDEMSYQYLYGATINYQESIAGSKFSISNPNASTTCGCGESFSA